MSSPSPGHLAASFANLADADLAATELRHQGFADDAVHFTTADQSPDLTVLEADPTRPPDNGDSAPKPMMGTIGLGAMLQGSGMASGPGFPFGPAPAGLWVAMLPERLSYLREQVKTGRTLVTVAAGAKMALARMILERNGGHTALDKDFEES